MSPETLRTKSLSFIINSLKKSKASFQIKKEKTNKKCYDFASSSHIVHTIKHVATLVEKNCSANDQLKKTHELILLKISLLRFLARCSKNSQGHKEEGDAFSSSLIFLCFSKHFNHPHITICGYVMCAHTCVCININVNIVFRNWSVFTQKVYVHP